ncbi:papilin-like [Sceloporus undulatus]|uniref:papilin-like n=1 Tax=Sceloporus undulatus TaxID=8520 RepID=UPI001C4C2837|nr:papilin-like [Sceloporus undulatus]
MPPPATSLTKSPPFLPHASILDKEGWCPPGQDRAIPPARVYCLWDASCPGGEKCCTLGTMQICMQPAMVGQGYCPLLCPSMEEPCLVGCLDDTWCGPGEKCCQVDCHVHCVPAEPARPGICPRKRILSDARPCANRCVDDRSCPEGQKCCFTGCGLDCVAPIAEKEGLCPARSPPGAIDPCFGRCSNDYQCPGKMKCCKIECGMACIEPVSVKPGACPLQLRGSMGPCPEPTQKNCSSDFDCEGAQKCCPIGCKSVCREPEEVRPGSCPLVAAETIKAPTCLSMAFCVRDNDCSQPHEKCCWHRCGWVCVAATGGNLHNETEASEDEITLKSLAPSMEAFHAPARPGECPRQTLPGLPHPNQAYCMEGQPCPGDEKCCRIGNIMKCVLPLGEKEGLCPARSPPDDIDPCFGKCLNDNQCPAKMKCCEIECGMACLEPVSEPPRPGECPNPTLPGLPRPIQSYCLEDKPCPGEEKCCRVGNIMKCILPFGVHHGYCPRNEADENAINSCSWDTDCALDKKCCLSEGSQRCIKPLPANPGLCPKKVLPPVLTPCKDKCRDDRSCPKGQKCCFIDCGLKCVPPESHHRGDHMELDLLGDVFSLEEDHGDVCLLPSDQGDCDARFPRFFFNSTSGKCEKFIYGGCGGNANNFVTKEKCLRVCAGEDVCLLPSDQGDCDAHIPRFFYNSASGECEKFIYGGCGGNENNFLNKEECLQVCSGKDHCLLPPNPGDCRDQYPRFFYNPAARRCQKFVYNGCGGNKNNFHTREDCLRVCAHVAPRKPGMCPSKPLHEIPRSGQAYCMDDSACPGDEKCCQIGNITKCVLPLEATHPGYCPSNRSATASSLRCFWDTDCASDEKCCPSQEHKRCTKAVPATPGSCPKKCLPWLFTRCANKCKDDRSCPDGYKCCFFECGLRCVPPQYPPAGQQMELDQDQALLVPEMDLGEREDTCPLASVLDEPDPCLHLFSLQTRCPRKWRYCQIDYGVPGLELQPDYCLLRPERGNCHREVTRFFYDSVTRKCKKFIYSGCGANENNFLTSTECLRVCEGAVTPKPGDCPRETFPEYQPLTYDYCFEDAACPGEEKCCRVGTIRKCFLLQGVHHGYCPEKKDVAVSSKSCSWDTNCAMDEKCCPSERRKRCTKAVPEKPGLCPMKCFARVFSRCKNECKDDRSCPEDKKCCFADCGLKCVPAVDRHGGHRTAVNGNCGAHLLMAVGECPKPQGFGICVEECTGDESCDPGEKCCSNGCGHVAPRSYEQLAKIFQQILE